MSYIAATFLYLYGGRHLKKCCRLHCTSCQQTRWKKTGLVSHSEACSFVTWPQCRCLMGSPMPRGLPMRFRSVDCLMYSKPQFILWLTILLCTASTGSPNTGIHLAGTRDRHSAPAQTYLQAQDSRHTSSEQVRRITNYSSFNSSSSNWILSQLELSSLRQMEQASASSSPLLHKSHKNQVHTEDSAKVTKGHEMKIQ